MQNQFKELIQLGNIWESCTVVATSLASWFYFWVPYFRQNFENKTAAKLIGIWKVIFKLWNNLHHDIPTWASRSRTLRKWNYSKIVLTFEYNKINFWSNHTTSYQRLRYPHFSPNVLCSMIYYNFTTLIIIIPL